MKQATPKTLAPITYLGAKRMMVKAIKVDREAFKAALASKEAAALAESFEDVGMIHAPLVRKSDKLLVSGLHRLAAVQLRGGKRAIVEVRLCECRDEDLEFARLAENAVRRKIEDRPALIRRMVEIRLALIESATPPPLPDAAALRISPPRGESARRVTKPRLPKTLAQEDVAAVLGMTTKAVQRIEERAKSVENEASPIASPIVLLGLTDVPKDIIDRAARAKQALKTVKGLLVQAESALTRASDDIPSAAWKRVYQACQAAAKDAAMAVPIAVCPYCKCVSSLMDKCTACAGMGFILDHQLPGVPRELLDENRHQVMDGGKVRERTGYNTPPKRHWGS